MGGKDHEVVGHGASEFLEALVKNARSLFHRIFESSNSVEKVGSADIANEDEISRESAERFIGGRAIGDDEGQVFGSVARRMPDINLNVAKVDRIAMVKEFDVALVRETILPKFVTFVGEVGHGPGRGREFTAAG